MKNKVLIYMLFAILVCTAIFIGFFMGRISGIRSFEKQSDDYTIADSPAKTKQINLNTANENDLIIYLDIDRSLAVSILSYRDTFGDFVYVSELKNIPGMTDSIYNRIRPYVTITD